MDGCCSRVRQEVRTESTGRISACCIIKEKIESVFGILCSIMATVTLIHQYATIQRIQLTQGEPFPMFLRGTCICEGTLCDHVLFTFNTTIPRDNYNWARVKGFREPKGKRDPGFDRLFESKFPTYIV